MKPPITQKMLVNWGGEQVLKEAQALVDRGNVMEAEYEPPFINGTILWNNRSFNTSLKLLPDGNAESHCPCYVNKERGMICSHVVAVGLLLVRRSTDPQREVKYQAELRRASRLATVGETEYILRVTAETPGCLAASICVTLADDWMAECRNDSIRIACEAEYNGKRLSLDQVPKDLPLCFSKEDEALLFVLDDISEGPAKGQLALNRFDFTNLIRLLAGRSVFKSGGSQITVNTTPMTTFMRMDLDRENGEIILIAHTELPFVKSGQMPFYIVSGRSGWVYGADNLWPLGNILPEPYHPIYIEPAIIPRNDVLRFFQQELPALSKSVRVESDISIDLFTTEPATPKFRLLIQGSPASLSAVLYARYEALELVACKPQANGHFAIPDPHDLMRYTIRHIEAEQQALRLLAPAGLLGEYGDDLSHIVGNREVLNFLGGFVPALRRRGWQIELDGKIKPYFDSVGFAMPVVHLTDVPNAGYFDVSFEFEASEGESLTPADIQLALRKGDRYIKRGDKTILIDSSAMESMYDVFSDCASDEGDSSGHFRLSNIYAAFVKSSLDALDGIDIEDAPGWRTRAAQYNHTDKIEQVELAPPLDAILRSYQKDAVNWLRFLEAHGFCGLLADEMGLGKTVETLAWLQLKRCDPESIGKPTLIVCPTSLVDNWAEEAVKFVPGMKVLTLTGSERHEKWEDLPKSDLVVTSYALLRRDLDRYLEHKFSVAVLDEAQHIKNRSTQNAQAAKQIKAGHKLVLTGTPMENSVSDLWSIMDFLMPGYLGSHDSFKHNYEIPISRGGPESEVPQTKLRRKLHPFLLRRLKTEVAKDLPEKIQKITSCSLTTDQRMVYNELLKASQTKIADMVSKNGFNKSRMEILATLMRLRQVCCHLDLLQLPGIKSQYPSGKMDLFFELLDEAMDAGHRALVFSQFVSMLTILRGELERRNLPYCYLDGSTKERMKEVQTFNSNRNIPLFLISLKAGGTGLNLTGADMVIHFDPWWNPAVEDQATDRAHRIGQKRTVYSVKLITKNTVEEKVLALQQRKKAIIDATIENDEKMIRALSWEDVQELLSM
jgi:superfamily II DNA or RNA helicase